LPVITKALLRRKVTPKTALFHHKNPDQKQIKRIYKEVHARDERLELNLYITQPDEDNSDQRTDGAVQPTNVPDAAPGTGSAGTPTKPAPTREHAQLEQEENE
ncbi:MAG: hypothetical protein WC558_14965, partial [Patulibacter sp.]